MAAYIVEDTKKITTQRIMQMKKDGKKIAVKDMPTQHIVNCMKIVGKDDSWYYVFKAELERRIRKN